MQTYVLTMMILGWVAFILNMLVVGLGVTPKARTTGQIVFSAIFGLMFTLWATYLYFGGK